jgi:hypothetical protein
VPSRSGCTGAATDLRDAGSHLNRAASAAVVRVTWTIPEMDTGARLPERSVSCSSPASAASSQDQQAARSDHGVGGIVTGISLFGGALESGGVLEQGTSFENGIAQLRHRVQTSP